MHEPWTNPATVRRCKGKQRLPSLKRATECAKRISERDNTWLIGYECPDCGGFHVGHARAQDYTVAEQVNRAGVEKMRRDNALRSEDFGFTDDEIE